MKKVSNIKKVINKFVLSLFVLILIIVLPMIGVFKDDNFERIYNAFLGEKLNYQGVIEIWNIDSFEGGRQSKYSLLKKVANDFQKKNKGVYVMIRDMSEQECLNLLSSNTFPDLFSCSFGVSQNIEHLVQSFSDVDTSEIEESAKIAGQKNNMQYGIAWCKGFYFLISSHEKIKKITADYENVELSKICLNAGYDKIENKKAKTIYSLGFGSSKYLCPQNIIKSYNMIEGNLISEKSFNMELLGQTQYSAYCNFIAGNSTILLGSQKDVFRIANREKLGKISGVLVEQFAEFTDLIQFMFLSKTAENEKKIFAEKFVQYLISQKQQDQICESGLFSVNKCVELKKDSAMQNITLQNFSNYTTFNVFIEKSEIKKFQQI